MNAKFSSNTILSGACEREREGEGRREREGGRQGREKGQKKRREKESIRMHIGQVEVKAEKKY